MASRVARHEKKKPRRLGSRLFVRGDRLNLTEPLHEFCLGFGSGQVVIVIASHRQLAPIIGATAF
jgi:hypothetical protein